jgi:hypothetical protein
VNASDRRVPLRPTAPSPDERIFPTLTTAQITRIAARRRRRTTARGDLLVEVGDKVIPFLLGAALCCDNSRQRRAINTLLRADIW